MLSRVLELEVMDSPEEATAYDAMDHSEVNRNFVDDLFAHGPFSGEILDLGVGTARIPIELCGRCAGVQVIGIDLAASMLDVARSNIESVSLSHRILLECQDSKQLRFEDGRFDVVMSNSIIHHVPDPERVLTEAARVVASGGLLFFRDLLRPVNEKTIEQLVATYAGKESQHAQQLFEDSLRASLTLDEVTSVICALGFAADGVTSTSDRHWSWVART